jgi:hypothetical protein
VGSPRSRLMPIFQGTPTRTDYERRGIRPDIVWIYG